MTHHDTTSWSRIVVRTKSGSTYLMIPHGAGVCWYRIPAGEDLSGVQAGWLPMLPTVVTGERLQLGILRSTPIVAVGFFPDGPEPPSWPVMPEVQPAQAAH